MQYSGVKEDGSDSQGAGRTLGWHEAEPPGCIVQSGTRTFWDHQTKAMPSALRWS